MRKRELLNGRTQKSRFYLFLLKHVATTSMAAEWTKIPQKNLCRYKREFEKAGLLWNVIWSRCPITGQMAWHITTNPRYAH